jgi:hypothetical protein
MSFGTVIFTNRGRALQVKAQIGTALIFTRIGVGDGALGGQAIEDLNALVHEVKSLTLNKFKTLTGGKAVVGGVLSNQAIVTGFYWRELGLFATDPDLGEILYCYGNAGALAEYIPAPGGAEILEKQVDVVTLVGNASSVSATIDQSLVYETPAGAQAKADAAIPKSLATAVSQFLVSSAVGVWAIKTIAEVKTLLGLGSAAYTASTAYATAAQGTKADAALQNAAAFATAAQGTLATNAAPASDLAAHKADYASKFYDNAGAHNGIYRGKYLGSTPTTEQYNAISSGIFTDLYIGDYWTIGGINYRIAGFNYFYNVGDTALTFNHAIVVPDTQLYLATMNATNITDGGYVGSVMRTANLAAAITTIKSAFSGHVVNHRQLLTNAGTSGKASGFAWYGCEVELMNEVMVYGSVAWGEATYNSGFNVGSSNGQLPLFLLRHDLIHNRQDWWLRDIVSATYFAGVTGSGYADRYSASSSIGVRPAFTIS